MTTGLVEVTNAAELTAAIADAVTAGYGDIRGVPGSTFTLASQIDVSDLYNCKIDLSRCQIDASGVANDVVGNTPSWGTTRGIAAATINATTITTDADYSGEFPAGCLVKIAHSGYSNLLYEINQVSSAGATGTSVPLEWPTAHAYDASGTMTPVSSGCGGLRFIGFNITGPSGTNHYSFNLQAVVDVVIEDLVTHESGGLYFIGRDIDISRWTGTAVKTTPLYCRSVSGFGLKARSLYLVCKSTLVNSFLLAYSGTEILVENGVVDGLQSLAISGQQTCYNVTVRNVTCRNGSGVAANRLAANYATGPYPNGKLVVCDCHIDSTFMALSGGGDIQRDTYILP